MRGCSAQCLSHQSSTKCPPHKPKNPCWKTNPQQFRHFPHVHWSPLCLRTGLKKQHLGTSGVGCLPDVLLDVGSAVLEVDQAALQLIVSLYTVLVLVLTAFPACRAWPEVFHAERPLQGEILGRNSIFSANSCGSVFLLEHIVILPCSNRNIILTVIMYSQALRSRQREFGHLGRALLNHSSMLNFMVWKTLSFYEPLKDFIFHMLGGGLGNASSPEASSVMGMHMPWLRELVQKFLVLSPSTPFSMA